MMSRPHFLPEDRYATEIKGTWYTGAGDEFVPDTTISLKLEETKRPASVPPTTAPKRKRFILQLVGILSITAAGVWEVFRTPEACWDISQAYASFAYAWYASEVKTAPPIGVRGVLALFQSAVLRSDPFSRGTQ